MKNIILSLIFTFPFSAVAANQTLSSGQAIVVCAVAPTSFQAVDALNSLLLAEQNQITYKGIVIPAPYSVSAPALTSYSEQTSATDQVCVTVTKL